MAEHETARVQLRELVLSDGGETQGDWEDLDEYLEEICSFGLDRLSREPDALTGECVRLQKQLEAVACGNYRALIESFECAGAVRDGVASVRQRLDSLVGILPELAETAKEFRQEATQAETARHRKLRTLDEHRRLLELAEIPQLMQTLIRSEMYDEALELGAHVSKIGVMHADVDAVQALLKQINYITNTMVEEILAVMRSTIQLPMCLRIVGYLRRLELYDEAHLRRLFLECRGQWMETVLRGVKTAPTIGDRLVRLSDDTRAMMFEIVTQYRAVFSDDASAGEHSNILHYWTLDCVAKYLQALQDDLENIHEGAALATVLQQTMYCGQSLGRVGADFRPLLPRLFENAVLRLVSTGLTGAVSRFEVMIEDYRWTNVKKSNEFEPVAGSMEQSGDSLSPPVEVLSYPPLAVFLNGMLAIFNELRSCPPISLTKEIAHLIDQSLLNSLATLSQLGGTAGSFLEPAERPQFHGLVVCWRDAAIPHIETCLNRCMARRAGMNLAMLQKAANDLLTRPT